MPTDEIEVPKELREFMPSNAEETILGNKNGAKKQYRYGNLHIREYDNKFLVHSDRADPRKNVMGHLIYDAPEVLIGLTCAALGGFHVAKKLDSKQSIPAGILSSIITGYLGYTAARRIKDRMRR